MQGWQLIEILCVLTVLDQAEYINGSEVRGIAGTSGPFEYRRGVSVHFLWTQPKLMMGTNITV